MQIIAEQTTAELAGQGTAIQVGVDSFAAKSSDDKISASETVLNLVERIKLADQIGPIPFPLRQETTETGSASRGACRRFLSDYSVFVPLHALSAPA
jgi:hypothetical protein